MSATYRPTVGAPAALLAGAAISLVGGMIGGVPGARMSVAAVVLMATGIVVTRLASPGDRPPTYPTGRTAPPTGYPTYDDIVHRLSWADSSPTYTARVLQPWLRELATTLGIDDLAVEGPGGRTVDVVERLEGESGDENR